jgi:hypothetical protein
MKLLSLEGKGLLISVGITIIMCGAITYYCHMRVKNVEVALMKQNQVLTSFITNVQNEIRKGSLNNSKPVDLSTPEAREAVKNIENKKIEVSDDEAESEADSESESGSGSESGSDSDSDSEDEASTCETASKAGASTRETASKADKDASKIKVLNLIKEDLKFIDTHDNFIDFHLKMNHFVNDFNTNSKIIELTDLEEITDFTIRHESDEDSDDDSDADSLSVSDSNSVSDGVSISNSISKSNSNSVKDVSNKQEFKKIVLTETIVDVKEELDNIKIEEINLDVDIDSSDFIKKIVKTEDKEKTSNINKMKIDDLREKVILSGLGTVESVKKLKKTDLITLLTNKD